MKSKTEERNSDGEAKEDSQCREEEERIAIHQFQSYVMNHDPLISSKSNITMQSFGYPSAEMKKPKKQFEMYSHFGEREKMSGFWNS